MGGGEQQRSSGKAMESVLSIILIFGGTGYIGRYMVKASVKMGHPTYVYSRPTTPQTHPSKIELLKEFQSMGVNIVQVIPFFPLFHLSFFSYFLR